LENCIRLHKQDEPGATFSLLCSKSCIMYNVNVLLVLGYIDKQLFGHQLRVLIMSMNLVVEKVIK